MKKQLISSLLVLTMLAGCTNTANVNPKEQSTVCTFPDSEQVNIQINVKSVEDTINGVSINVQLDYEDLGFDLSDISDDIKESMADSILDQLGFDSKTQGVNINTEFTDKSFTADISLDLNKADPKVLEKFGLDNIEKKDMSLSVFLDNAKEAGLECK